MHKYAHKKVSSLALLIVGILLAGLLFFIFPPHAISASSTPITGWAWSDNIGWISLNCSNTGSCGASDYGFIIGTGGNISGYAWSDNIGWISANETGCPGGGSCNPKISPATGAMSGWLKVISGGAAQSGGWDGWISLGGSGYGPVLTTNGIFSGYAWGSDIVGWTSFAYAQTAFQPCVPDSNVCLDGIILRHYNADCTYTDAACQFAAYGYGCSVNACLVPPSPSANPSVPGGLQILPKLVRSGNTTQVKWSIDNASSTTCTVTGTNGDSWPGLASGTKTSSAINQQTIYTLHCNGSAVDILTFDAQATVNIVPTFKEI